MMYDIPIVALSLQVAFVATGLTLPIGLITAWLLVRKNFRGKFLLDVFVSLPLALPPVVVGYVLLWLVGTQGWVGQISHGLFGSTVAFTWFAAVLASSVVSFPLVVRSFTVALAGVDPKLEVAAKGLGAGSLRTFLTVTLPIKWLPIAPVITIYKQAKNSLAPGTFEKGIRSNHSLGTIVDTLLIRLATNRITKTVTTTAIHINNPLKKYDLNVFFIVYSLDLD